MDDFGRSVHSDPYVGPREAWVTLCQTILPQRKDNNPVRAAFFLFIFISCRAGVNPGSCISRACTLSLSHYVLSLTSLSVEQGRF